MNLIGTKLGAKAATSPEEAAEHAETRLAKLAWLQLAITKDCIDYLKKEEEALTERIINQNNLNNTPEVLKAVSELKRVRELRKSMTDLS